MIYQVAAVCYRYQEHIEFLLVKTSSGKWTFPKGNIDLDIEESKIAEIEALEEGGVCGNIQSNSFTDYLHLKEDGNYIVELTIKAYLLEVTQTKNPIELQRFPTWFSASQAKAMLALERQEKYQQEFTRVIDLAMAKI